MTTSGQFGGSLTTWCRVSRGEPIMVKIDDEYFVLMDGAYPTKAVDSRQDAYNYEYQVDYDMPKVKEAWFIDEVYTDGKREFCGSSVFVTFEDGSSRYFEKDIIQFVRQPPESAFGEVAEQTRLF